MSIASIRLTRSDTRLCACGIAQLGVIAQLNHESRASSEVDRLARQPIDETCQKIGCFDPRHACRNVDLRVVPRTLGEAVDDQSQEVVAGTCVVGGRAAGEIRLSIDTQMRQRADPVACDEADPRVPDLFPASRCTHICLHLSLYTRRILHMYRDYYGHSTLYAYRGIESVALMHLCHTLGVGGSSPTAPFLAQYPVGRWVSLTDGAT